MSRRLPKGVSPVTLGRVLWHLPKFARVFVRLESDPRVQWWVKLIPVLVVAYLVSPFDLDWLPVIGWMDDAALVALGARWFVRLCPPEVVSEHVKSVQQVR